MQLSWNRLKILGSFVTKCNVCVQTSIQLNLLSSLGHLGVHRATSIQTFDFSTLYTSIPHDLLKSRMNNITNNAFKHKNGATRYTHIKVGRNNSYFTTRFTQVSYEQHHKQCL